MKAQEYKKLKIDLYANTKDIRQYDKETGNFYKSIVIMSKRADQIAAELKQEFQENSHLQAPQDRSGEEEEDGVGAGSAERQGVELLEEAGGGEPLVVVVVAHGALVVLVERLERDPLAGRTADLGRFFRGGAGGVHFRRRCRHNGVHLAAKVRGTDIHRKG